MPVLVVQEGEDLTEIESGVKNKWRWAWLYEKGENDKPFGSWCKKVREAGTCFCTVCNKTIQYGANGKKIL